MLFIWQIRERRFEGGDLEGIKEDLGRLVANRNVLICLDDVWRIEDAKWFIFDKHWVDDSQVPREGPRKPEPLQNFDDNSDSIFARPRSGTGSLRPNLFGARGRQALVVFRWSSPVWWEEFSCVQSGACHCQGMRQCSASCSYCWRNAAPQQSQLELEISDLDSVDSSMQEQPGGSVQVAELSECGYSSHRFEFCHCGGSFHAECHASMLCRFCDGIS